SKRQRRGRNPQTGDEITIYIIFSTFEIIDDFPQKTVFLLKTLKVSHSQSLALLIETFMII
ncbi:MAG TPA: hypothetical protein PLR13_11315, partial [Smithella sp.]|nr:hypothetical protein [Smithella sp.]